jgi:hypothetical protein
LADTRAPSDTDLLQIVADALQKWQELAASTPPSGGGRWSPWVWIADERDLGWELTRAATPGWFTPDQHAELAETQRARAPRYAKAHEAADALEAHGERAAEILERLGLDSHGLLAMLHNRNLHGVREVMLQLRHALVKLRAAADPPSPPADARLQIEGLTVRLDGRPVPLNMTEEARNAALCLLCHLLAAAGNWRSGRELDNMEQAGPCREHIEVRWDRVRKQLPACLLELVESNRRKGYRLLPAVWHR